jgi:uncharacterized protein YecE (DUF72 family)
VATARAADNPIRVGCAGWNIRRDAAVHFAPSGSHLLRYSQSFNCCEVNSSFYRPHRETTWQRWAVTVSPNFQFSVKAPKAITHTAALQGCSSELKSFLQQIRFLGDKLGPVLFQLPPSFQFEPRRCAKFLSLLRKHFPGDVVWEPRHETWFQPSANKLLTEFKIARVAADPACVPEATQPGGDSGLVYFRLHGSPRTYYSTYSDEFLARLRLQLEECQKHSKVWCIFDNTALGSATLNALFLSNLPWPKSAGAHQVPA